jgi:hypothetical protein
LVPPEIENEQHNPSPGVILRVPKMPLRILFALGGNSNVVNHQQILGVLLVSGSCEVECT